MVTWLMTSTSVFENSYTEDKLRQRSKGALRGYAKYSGRD